MLAVRSVAPSQLCRAFLEAFADYAMDVRGTTETRLLLRMRKNCVDFDLSPGLYESDRLVGFTMIGVDRWGDRLTAYDAGTGIVPEHRHQGWAKRMFEHALPSLRDRGVEQFVLEALKQNEPAIRAYRKSGFDIVRELRCYVAETDALRALDADSTFEIRSIGRAVFAQFETSADFLPSFENRFSAADALPDDVRLTGAFDGETCVGAIAYLPPLNWLLSLVVDRNQRRRGAGTALIRHLATTLPASVSRLPALNVDGEAVGTQAFLDSLGFRHLTDQYEMQRPL